VGLYSDIKGAMSCKTCRADEISNNGGTACERPPWNIASDCDEFHYLWDNSRNNSQWYCHRCPEGGSCHGNINQDGIVALFGWARCNTRSVGGSSETSFGRSSKKSGTRSDTTFVQCIYKPACLGATNTQISDKYFLANGTDLAKRNDDEACALGYIKENNTRCSQCAYGYTNRPGSGQCILCEPTGSITLVTLTVFFSIVSFVVLIALKIRASTRRRKEHNTLKRTLVNHVQLVSIVMSLSVPWPYLVAIVLNFVSGLTSISNHASSLQCSGGTVKDITGKKGATFYTALVISALFPFVMTMIFYFYWFVLVPCDKSDKRLLSCGRKLKRVKFVPTKNPFRVRRKSYDLRKKNNNLPLQRSSVSHRIRGGPDIFLERQSSSNGNNSKNMNAKHDSHNRSIRDGW
jgi:hypothetical protein